MEKSADAFRTISEVADLLETPAHVLRFWESRFPQIKPVKRAGGRRYYRPSDVSLLTGIKRLLHDEGMTIRGVQRILRENGVRHVAGLSDDPSPEEEALEAAMMARLDIEEVSPRTTVEIAAEQALALEAALQTPVSVVLPFRLPDVAAEADKGLELSPLATEADLGAEAVVVPDDAAADTFLPQDIPAPAAADDLAEQDGADVWPTDATPTDTAPTDSPPVTESTTPAMEIVDAGPGVANRGPAKGQACR